jgi:hypothetical protein
MMNPRLFAQFRKPGKGVSEKAFQGKAFQQHRFRKGVSKAFSMKRFC